MPALRLDMVNARFTLFRAIASTRRGVQGVGQLLQIGVGQDRPRGLGDDGPIGVDGEAFRHARDAQVQPGPALAVHQHQAIGVAQFFQEGVGGDGVVLIGHADHGDPLFLELHQMRMLQTARRAPAGEQVDDHRLAHARRLQVQQVAAGLAVRQDRQDRRLRDRLADQGVRLIGRSPAPPGPRWAQGPASVSFARRLQPGQLALPAAGGDQGARRQGGQHHGADPPGGPDEGAVGAHVQIKHEAPPSGFQRRAGAKGQNTTATHLGADRRQPDRPEQHGVGRHHGQQGGQEDRVHAGPARAQQRRGLVQGVPPVDRKLDDRQVDQADQPQHRRRARRLGLIVDRGAQGHVAEVEEEQHQHAGQARVPHPPRPPHGLAPQGAGDQRQGGQGRARHGRGARRRVGQRMAEHQGEEAGHAQRPIGHQAQAGGRDVDEHDAHGVALLIVGRRGEAEPGPQQQQAERADPQHRNQGAGEAHEAVGIGEAEHGPPITRPSAPRQAGAALVGQDDVRRALDEGQQFGAPAMDDEAVRQGDGDLAARGMGGGGGGLEGGAGRGRVEQIAFQIDDGAVADHARVDVGRGQLVGGAQEGAHGALAVRRDVDQAAAGAEALARAVFQYRGVEVDADGADVVAENLAQRVFRHLADIGGAPAERRRTPRPPPPWRHTGSRSVPRRPAASSRGPGPWLPGRPVRMAPGRRRWRCPGRRRRNGRFGRRRAGIGAPAPPPDEKRPFTPMRRRPKADGPVAHGPRRALRSRAHDRRRRPDPRSGRPHLFDPVAGRAGPAGRGAGDGGDHGPADALDRSRRERPRPDGLPPGPAAAGLGLSSGPRPLGPGLHDLGRGGRAPGQSGRDPALERRQTLSGPPGGKGRRRARDDLRRPRRRCGSGSRLRRHGRQDPDRQADRLGRRLAHPAGGGG
uniref:LigA n=1 Tax=Parastrongyloides trichosuri TaxID=131310 RepID=A0A0N4ZIW8_PARTI